MRALGPRDYLLDDEPGPCAACHAAIAADASFCLFVSMHAPSHLQPDTTTSYSSRRLPILPRPPLIKSAARSRHGRKLAVSRYRQFH